MLGPRHHKVWPGQPVAASQGRAGARWDAMGAGGWAARGERAASEGHQLECVVSQLLLFLFFFFFKASLVENYKLIG